MLCLRNSCFFRRIDWAFSECDSLKEIKLPNSLTNIADFAFTGCSSLTEVVIPNNVTSIGEGAFSDCVNLTTITIPDSVTCIEESVFDACDDLRTLILKVKGETVTIDLSEFDISLSDVDTLEELILSVLTGENDYKIFERCNAILVDITETAMEIETDIEFEEDICDSDIAEEDE